MTNIDLLVMPHGFTDGLSHHDLYRDDWVCLVSADNPDVGEELTIDHLRTMPWVASYHGPTAATPASRQMRMLGIEPHVQVVTENFLTVPALVAGTPRVALLQRRLADDIPAEVGRSRAPLPLRRRTAGGGHLVAPDVRRRPGTPVSARCPHPDSRSTGAVIEVGSVCRPTLADRR